MNIDDWASLCKNCHTATHSIMKLGNIDWNDIERILKKLKDERED